VERRGHRRRNSLEMESWGVNRRLPGVKYIFNCFLKVRRRIEEHPRLQRDRFSNQIRIAIPSVLTPPWRAQLELIWARPTRAWACGSTIAWRSCPTSRCVRIGTI
jgi:hypothetical protein